LKAVLGALADLAATIARLSGEVGRRVEIDVARIADRSGTLDLQPPGTWSANRSCRLIRTADGWMAVNLPRTDDREAVPAWIGCRLDTEPWSAIVRRARRAPWYCLVENAKLLGLPVAGVGEIKARRPDAPLIRVGSGGRLSDSLKVIDLSSLWAGPLAGSILAAAGADVVKIESRVRPDTLRVTAPAFFARLNGAKREAVVDLGDAAGRQGLADMIASADVVITSARPRAFAQLGLQPERLFALNPGLTWVAISGYGWSGPGADRVAFGDDAAAAGGLVRWTASGAPRFSGDALADPLTGLAAAAGALNAVRCGGGFLVDAALAQTAAGVATAFA
jgi:hypothetical protein